MHVTEGQTRTHELVIDKITDWDVLMFQRDDLNCALECKLDCPDQCENNTVVLLCMGETSGNTKRCSEILAMPGRPSGEASTGLTLGENRHGAGICFTMPG